MKRTSLKKIATAGIVVAIAGCATNSGQPNAIQQTFNDTFNNSDPCANNARNAGMALGGIAGALIGAKTGDRDAANIIVGAVLGTTVGGLVGANIDKRRCALAEVARQYQLQMTFAAVRNDGSVLSEGELQRMTNADEVKKNAIGSIVSLQNESGEGGHFGSNSDELTPRAERYFSAIADIYNQEKAVASIADPGERREQLRVAAQRKLLLVGHTDDTGQSRANAELSERRARAVALYLERRGIPRDQVYYQGAGEIYPVADNATPSGRALNRRVEIVEMNNAASFSRFLETRRPTYQFYRTKTKSDTAIAAEQVTSDAHRDKNSTPRKATPNRPEVGVRAAHAGSPAAVASTPNVPAPPGLKPLAPKDPRTDKSVPTSPSVRDALGTNSTGEKVPAALSTTVRSIGRPLDFGGVPMSERRTVVAGLGKVERQRSLFSLISNANADELPVLSDCSQDRPRLSGAVKALRDGATYKVAEHVPGLYGKSWTERVNGHQIVVNKVAVLASEASLAQIPEFKIYANYNPAEKRNPKPEVSLRPEVNTYLGEGGILYRIFTNGAAGTQCIDILYHRNGGASAKGGSIVYARNDRLYISDFKPVIGN